MGGRTRSLSAQPSRRDSIWERSESETEREGTQILGSQPVSCCVVAAEEERVAKWCPSRMARARLMVAHQAGIVLDRASGRRYHDTMERFSVVGEDCPGWGRGVTGTTYFSTAGRVDEDDAATDGTGVNQLSHTDESGEEVKRDGTYPPCSEMRGSKLRFDRRREKSHWPGGGW